LRILLLRDGNLKTKGTETKNYEWDISKGTYRRTQRGGRGRNKLASIRDPTKTGILKKKMSKYGCSLRNTFPGSSLVERNVYKGGVGADWEVGERGGYNPSAFTNSTEGMESPRGGCSMLFPLGKRGGGAWT